jgi:hypothetical protein
MHIIDRYPATVILTVLCIAATFLFTILQAVAYV